MIPWNDDCVHFRGHIPCAPNKRDGSTCPTCSHYRARSKRILIIKLGATGDVIRTTPLLHLIEQQHPGAEVWWLTETPAVVPDVVHHVLPMNLDSVLRLQGTPFDVVYSLDKDPHACALASSLQATMIYGFVLRDGVPAPANSLANHKFVTGIFDDVSKANTLSYPQELIELCGGTWSGQRYIAPVQLSTRSAERPRIGLNTGCGTRWLTREWPIASWTMLIQRLREAGYDVVLLGGPSEHQRNVELSSSTGASYGGVQGYRDFFATVGSCTVIVTAVTMALHVAIAMGTRIVLMNNIFNSHEFELYGLGEIVEPTRTCQCYFRGTCSHQQGSCMQTLSVEAIEEATARQLALAAAAYE